MKNADAPAMPQSGVSDIDGCTWVSEEMGGLGLTKREHFAGLAMQGLTTREGYGSPEMLAADAVAYADALLAKLDRADD